MEENTPMKLKNMIALVLGLLMLLGMAHAQTQMDGYALNVIREINAERAARGLNELNVDAELTRAARIRAEEIVQKFSHTRPDGSRWKTVSSAALAENIARGQKTADKAVAAWMTSDGHRRNILREGYTKTGVACVRSGNVYYWVQLFGK